MSWPENDTSLHELRRKWDEGHFRQDADSVYGIDEAVDEAISQLLFAGGGIETINPPTAWLSPHERVSEDIIKDIDDRMFGNLPAYPDNRPKEKTCRICCLTATNDPCDTCYSRWRRASQTPSEAGFCVFCRNKSPSVICVPCTERILRDGFG